MGYFLRLFLSQLERRPEKKQLELQVQKLEMLKNIEFIGEVPNKKIASYFSDSLISISSSIHEAFGFVNIEAMREGTPIISTPTAGAMEILNENQNGEFFTLDESNSLTNAVSVILNNWDSFSSKALESFNSYSLESQINTHRELLNESIK